MRFYLQRSAFLNGACKQGHGSGERKTSRLAYTTMAARMRGSMTITFHVIKEMSLKYGNLLTTANEPASQLYRTLFIMFNGLEMVPNFDFGLKMFY